MASTALPLEPSAPAAQPEGRASTDATLAYRPDIDGMRAVAVLLVLLFHAGFAWLPGGFVGVDVFFVLTGFLITGVLSADMRANRFSFANFYLRRIRRLLPALVFVCSVTAVVGFFVLMPDDLLALLDSCRFALASASNIYFWLNTGGYFDADVHELPLLHTWSLGVEEQFYLLWPAALFLARRHLAERRLTLGLAAAALLGLGVSQWWAVRWPGAAYFLLPARAFEILIGAVLALEAERCRALSSHVRSLLSVLGLCLMLGAALLLDEEATFPGINALWPCLGTALLIASGTGSAGVINRCLSVKPLVVIGLLSYSIYLWHWPLLAFLSYRGTHVVGTVRWLVIVAPITAAALTYLLVEHPLRYRVRLKLAQALPALVLVPIALSLAAFSVTRAHAGFPGRFAAVAGDEGSEDATEGPGGCEYGRDLTLGSRCLIGVASAKSRGLLVGDSYAGMYVHFLDALAKDAGLAFNYRWYRLTPPIPGVSVGPRSDRTQVDYSQRRHELLGDFDIALLGNSWGGYTYAKKEKKRLWNARGKDVSARADELQLAAIADLVQRGVRVVLLDRPRAPAGREMMRKVRAAVASGQSLAGFSAPVAERASDYILNRVRKEFPSVLIIRPDDPICDDTSCRVAIGETPLYRADGSHLNHEGAKLMAKEYLKRFPNPLKRLR
jgi:peptidoglycan/LPS O-acetylase OafA/YrhL